MNINADITYRNSRRFKYRRRHRHRDTDTNTTNTDADAKTKTRNTGTDGYEKGRTRKLTNDTNTVT